MTEIFIDTADTAEIKRWLRTHAIMGVTTNQSIFLEKAKGCNFDERAREILNLVYPLPVSLEGPNDLDGLKHTAVKFTTWKHLDGLDNVVIKVPMLGNGDGLRAVGNFRRAGLMTNVTACMNTNQTFLAKCAGATYVSVFYNRMIDWKYQQLDPHWTPKDEKGKTRPKSNEGFLQIATDYALEVIDVTMGLLENSDTQLIVGSIRSPQDIEDILTVEPDIITIPTGILDQMPMHSATDAALAQFEEAWEKFCKAEKHE